MVEQALHEALMRQEELLAYIDSQEAAKFQVSFCYCVVVEYHHSRTLPLLGLLPYSFYLLRRKTNMSNEVFLSRNMRAFSSLCY